MAGWLIEKEYYENIKKTFEAKSAEYHKIFPNLYTVFDSPLPSWNETKFCSKCKFILLLFITINWNIEFWCN